MDRTFDPKDENSWYFGKINRISAQEILQHEDGGVFLVRDSSSIPGEYVLCVKEDGKVCHYIINKVTEDEEIQYKIGDRCFPSMPELLSFYRLHYLDTTPLVRPAKRVIEKVIAKHDFEGKDSEDLPFKKGEVLTVINKVEEQWWFVVNSSGTTGVIPANYVKPYVEKGDKTESPLPVTPKARDTPSLNSEISSPKAKTFVPELTKDTYAIVKQPRVPNAYDHTALKLQIGDIIKVSKINISGQWEGEVVVHDANNPTTYKPTGRKGHFPFTHVELVDQAKPKQPNPPCS